MNHQNVERISIPPLPNSVSNRVANSGLQHPEYPHHAHTNQNRMPQLKRRDNDYDGEHDTHDAAPFEKPSYGGAAFRFTLRDRESVLGFIRLHDGEALRFGGCFPASA
jgi:hypothetical protein